jgi:hypothetical protein
MRKASDQYLGNASPKLLNIVKMMCSKVDKFIEEEKDATLRGKISRDFI